VDGTDESVIEWDEDDLMFFFFFVFNNKAARERRWAAEEEKSVGIRAWAQEVSDHRSTEL